MKIRKRVVISAIITILIVIATNKYWLLFSPMPVDFDVKGHGTVDIEVQLNKKDNDKFNKTKSQTVNIDLNKNNHASFNIQRAKYPKRIRINIFYAKKNEPLELGNVNFRHGKLTLDNLDKFAVEGANYSVENQHLILKPTDNKIVLTYPETLKIRTATKFDFKVFMIILILTFLLAYKLSDYIADFKTVEGKSRVDILFLTIFFAFLFVPMSHIDQKEMSKQENRFLAKWQPLIKENNEINFDFGKNFNDWFNDRFCLRQELVNIYTFISMTLDNKCNEGVFDKKQQMLYTKYVFGHFGVDLAKKNFESLYKFNEFFKTHNIKLYVLIVPGKADVYPTQYNYLKDDKLHTDFLNYISEIQKENKLKVIYPFEELKNGTNNEMMYFKTEHHWTDDGAFIGYKAIIKEINKDYPNIKPLTGDDFEYFYDKRVRGEFNRKLDNGQDCWRMGLSDFLCNKYHTYDYRYYKHKAFDNLETQVINTDHHYGKIFHYDKGAKLRVIQLGTSQNENLTEFIPFTFRDVKRLRINTVKNMPFEEEYKLIKYYKDEMLEYKPDIVIFCITYDNIKRLHKLVDME